MPELPEVETTIRGLKSIVGSTIVNIKINTPKLRFFIPKNIQRIKNHTKIINIKRIGKFILINLSEQNTIVLHLGMSGRLRLYSLEKFHRQKHDHFILKTNNNKFLVFNDARRFGFVDFDKTYLIHNRKYILNLGIDALDKKLTANMLFSKISNTMVPIKQILLNQRIISGIGNIYASEILFDAKISPLQQGKDISLFKCRKIVISTRIILLKAIKKGGSSLRDYVSVDGELGNFQNNFKVYNREGEKILGKNIKKIVQYGRSTYYCPELQIIN